MQYLRPLLLPLAFAFSTLCASAAPPSPRHEIPAGSALPSDLPAGNFTLHLPPDTPLPRDGNVVAIDAEGARVIAPLTRQIHLHVSAPLRAVEWSPAPPAAGFAIEPIPPYTPRMTLRHERASLPLASTTETEEFILSIEGDLPANALPSLPPLPHRASVAVVTSWDDGHVNDLRLAQLLHQHGYVGTFFMNEFSHARRRDLAALEALGMEIGSHTINHPKAWAIPPDAWLIECLQMLLGLEASLGHPVVSFAYPYNHTPAFDARGDYVLRAVRDSGYSSARSTRTRGETLSGYADPLSFATDGHFLMPAERLEAAWLRASSTTTDDGVFYFWGHSSEIRAPESWTALDETLARYARRPNTWYATQGQLFLWRWAHAHVRIEQLPPENNRSTRFKLSLPLLAPYWRQQLHLSLRLPPGATRVSLGDTVLPATEGFISLPSPRTPASSPPSQ